MENVLKPNGFGGEVGLDWGGIGLVLGAEPRGIGREDGAGVASLLFKDRDFWVGLGNNCAQLMGITDKRLRRFHPQPYAESAHYP